MARTCSICSHPDRAEIDTALVVRGSLRGISRTFDLSEDALTRHRDNHLPPALAQSARVEEITRADDLVDRLIGLARETQAILAAARKDGNHDLALKAIQRAEKQLELQARLVGELRDAPVVNITLAPAWIQIQAVIVQALDAYPEARLAVVHALQATPCLP
jgi:hypothetical protein